MGAGCERASEGGSTAGPAAEEKTAGHGDAEAPAAVRELGAVLEKALKAYNAGNQAALFADFASTATPAPGDRIFTELFEGYYKAEFGRIMALRLSPRESFPDPDFGMLVYDATCELWPFAKVSANFVRENGTPKIVQLRMEKVEVAEK